MTKVEDGYTAFLYFCERNSAAVLHFFIATARDNYRWNEQKKRGGEDGGGRTKGEDKEKRGKWCLIISWLVISWTRSAQKIV